MQPKYIDLPEKKVVGMGVKFISIFSPDKNNMKTIPALWGQFLSQISRISNRVGGACFGLVEILPEAGGEAHKGEMSYIAAAEVADFDSVPAGMIYRTIPAGRYASFTHTGTLMGLENTMNQIYNLWLPKSGVQLRNAPHLEFYDYRFIPDSDKSEFDILLPLR